MLVLRAEDRENLAGAAEDELRRGQIGDGADMDPARYAVGFDLAAVVGVGQKIHKAEQTDERHQDAQTDPAMPELCFSHVS